MTYPPQPPGPPWAQGPQGGYPVGPPPKKSRTGLVAALIIVAILVVGGGGVTAYLLLDRDGPPGSGSGGSGDESRGARTAAQTYVRELEDALNTPLQDVDISKLEPVTCADDYTQMEDELTDAKESGQSASPGDEVRVQIRMKDFERTSDGAKFTMTQRAVGDDDSESLPMTVAEEDGDWKVCGAYDDGGDDGGGDGGGDEPSEEGPGEGPSGAPLPSEPPSGELPPNPIPTT